MLQIQLLGRFQASANDIPIKGLDKPRLQALVGLLAMHHRDPLSRSQIAGTFWPESAQSQALTNLRNLIHRLRRHLPDADNHIVQSADSIAWQPGTAQVDLHELIDTVQALERSADLTERRRLLRAALRLNRGRLLVACEGDWLEPHRDRLHAWRRQHSLDLVDLVSKDEPDLAVRLLQGITKDDPCDEGIQTRLINLLASIGDRAGALRAYHACVDALERELGVGPSPGLNACYEVLASDIAQATPRARPTGLVGRDVELERLAQLWRQARPGISTVARVRGDAGIGKSALIEAFAHALKPTGVTTSIARCYEIDRATPHQAAVAWLRDETLRNDWASLDDIWLEQLAIILPELDDDDTPTAPGDAWQKMRLFEALTQAIHCVQRPTLLILDDGQWADSETAAWLPQLLRHASAATVMVVVAERSHEGTPLSSAYDEAARRQTIDTIDLAPLDESTTAELAALVSDSPLAPEANRRLFEISEGNPLFAIEQLRAGDDALGNNAAIPESVRATIASRLNRVSESARHTLESAAVIARGFTMAQLAAIGQNEQEAVAVALDELWRHGLIHHQGSTYDFSHARIRDVVVANLSPPKRQTSHLHLARYLSQTGGRPGDVAHHFDAAGDSPEAVAWYVRAIDHARSQFAHEEAARLCQRTLDILAEGNGDPVERVELLERHAEAAINLGRAQEAVDSLQAGLDLCRPSDQAIRARLHRALMTPLGTLNEYERADNAYTDAHAVLGSNPVGRADLRSEYFELQLARLGSAYWRADIHEMTRVGEMMAKDLDLADPSQRCRFWLQRVAGRLRKNRYAEGDSVVDWCTQAVSAARGLGEGVLMGEAVFLQGFTALCLGDIGGARAPLEEGLSRAQRIGFRWLELRARTYLTVWARRSDQPGAARAHAEAAIELALTLNLPAYRAAAQGNFAWLALRDGRCNEAVALVQTAATSWETSKFPYPFQWIARLPAIAAQARSGDLDGARVHAEVLVGPDQHRLPHGVDAGLNAFVAGDDAALQPTLDAATSAGLL